MIILTYYQLFRNYVLFGHDLKDICLLMLYCVIGVRNRFVIFNSFFIILVFRFCIFFLFRLIRSTWGEFLFVNCDPAMKFYIGFAALRCGASSLVDCRFFGLLSNFRSYVIKFMGSKGKGKSKGKVIESNLIFLTRLPSFIFISSVL